MLKRPDDWRTAFFEAQIAQEAQAARDKARMASAIRWGIALGVFGYVLQLIVG